MYEKILAVLSALVLAAGCSTGTLTGVENKNGRVYKNYNENYVDGFCYNTEEQLTGVFIVYSSELLYSVSEDWYFTEYDTGGLLDNFGLYQGDFIELTYDVQHTTGGIAGVRESELLKVYDCKTIKPTEALKADFASNGIWQGRAAADIPHNYIAFNENGEKFIAVSDGQKYYVYTPEDDKPVVFDEERTVEMPVSTIEDENIKAVGIRVLCNADVSDERVAEVLKTGTFDQNDDIMLLGFCRDRNKSTADAAEFADAEYDYIENAKDERECRVLITNEQFENGVTAEAVGLPEEVFERAQSLWNNMRYSYKRTVNGMDDEPYDRDVAVLGGRGIKHSSVISFDNNGKMTECENIQNMGDVSYMLICTRGEFFDYFPF